MTNPLKNNILRVVGYFDLFDYPLTREEIHSFLDQPAKSKDLFRDLDQLTEQACLYKYGELYSLKNDPALIQSRILGNQRAQTLLNKAARISRFLFAFPFVRGICISGSLSKNFAKEEADIDYFIITAPGKLWIARTIMHLWKKLTFITGHQHWFCMNYYIDEMALLIEEQNIFTATELVTLLPACGPETLSQFFKTNDWAYSYFPNRHPRMLPQSTKPALFKRLVESAFDNSFGEWLDRFFMNWTTKRWKEKEDHHKVNIKGGRMGLRTGKHFSKPNPEFFQHKLLARYQNKLTELDASWNAHGGAIRSALHS